MLGFLKMETLEGKSFLDVGCGSGIHSLAAQRAGAEKIFSFDYDINSVQTTKMLRKFAGNTENWQVTQGSILDLQFVNSLEAADIVYAWGVLHHTGAMWQAVENTARLMKPDGVIYLALYTSGVTYPSDEFWLEIKKQYNRSGWLAKRQMELWYIWRFMLGNNLRGIPALLKRSRDYKKERGMDLYIDIVDWLGGWPMEFAGIEDVKQFCSEKMGLTLINIQTGQANTEYLFKFQ